MNKILTLLAYISILLIEPGCAGISHSANPVIGNWNSLWAGSQHINLDFNLHFKSNNSFHLTISGPGQAQPENVLGIYGIHGDTLTILDKYEEPIQLCSYSDTGRYTFVKKMDTLFFKVIEDKCERRKLTLEMGLITAK